MYAVTSTFIIDHDKACHAVHFTNNKAEKSGGVYFESNSFFVLTTESILKFSTAIEFTSNKAEVGRALFVSGNTFSSTCSIPVLSKGSQAEKNSILSIILLNKSDIIITRQEVFGGDCSNFKTYYLDEDTNAYSSSFVESSHPVEVNLCFCTNGYPNCSYQHPSIYIKKGKKFTISVVAVDLDNTSINTSVRVSLSPEAGLAIGQTTQMTNSSCTDLIYNIYSPHDSEQLMLMITDSDCKSNDTRNVQVHFLPCICPIGFQTSSEESNCDCVCDPKLFQYINGCNLKTQSVVRATNAWITYENDSLPKPGYIIYPHCPYDYCLPESRHSEINLNLPNGSNAQCDRNHAEMLCGSCLPGYSLSLGSSNCIWCVQYWPAVFVVVIIVAFFSGFILLFIVKLLNLAVTAGTINGLIFYSNNYCSCI